MTSDFLFEAPEFLVQGYYFCKIVSYFKKMLVMVDSLSICNFNAAFFHQKAESTSFLKRVLIFMVVVF